MRRLLAIAIALVALGAAALPGLASAGTIRDFQTPSKNIACAFVPADIAGGAAFLRCEIRSGLKPVPPRPRACDADWGQAVSMTRTSRGRAICISDTIRNPQAPILGYGKTFKAGPFTCKSRTDGLRCTNVAGHGWFLSKESTSLF